MKAIIKQTLKRVEDILVKHPKARSNEMELYCWYFKRYYGTTDLNEIKEMTNVNVFDSISRTRRKVQARNPLLWAERDTRKNRQKAEEVWREEMTK